MEVNERTNVQYILVLMIFLCLTIISHAASDSGSSSDPCNRPEKCQPGDVFTDPYDCMQYYHCDNKKEWEVRRCPEGEGYDFPLQWCVSLDFLTCFDGECPTIAPEITTAPDIVTTEAASGSLSDPCNRPDKCKPGTVIADPYNCTQYYHCEQNKEWQVRKCPEGEGFDYPAQWCVKPEFLTCFDGECPTITPEITTVPDIVTTEAASGSLSDPCNRPDKCKPSTLIADPYDCTQYFQCNNAHDWQVKICPDGSAWDHPLLMCADIDNVTCFDGQCSTIAPQITVPDIVTEATLGPLSDPCNRPDKCKPGTVIADPYDCTQYYQCKSAFNWQVKICPDGFAWDHPLRRCVDIGSVTCFDGECPTIVTLPGPQPDLPTACDMFVPCPVGLKVPDPDDCQLYYECVEDGMSYAKMDCSKSQLFDRTLRTCVKNKLATCQGPCTVPSTTTSSTITTTVLIDSPTTTTLYTTRGEQETSVSTKTMQSTQDGVATTAATTATNATETSSDTTIMMTTSMSPSTTQTTASPGVTSTESIEDTTSLHQTTPRALTTSSGSNTSPVVSTIEDTVTSPQTTSRTESSSITEINTSTLAPLDEDTTTNTPVPKKKKVPTATLR